MLKIKFTKNKTKTKTKTLNAQCFGRHHTLEYSKKEIIKVKKTRTHGGGDTL